jgi:hypothetical protein
MALLKFVSVIQRKNAWRAIRKAVATVQDSAPHSGQSPQEQEEEIARWVKAARLEHRHHHPDKT